MALARQFQCAAHLREFRLAPHESRKAAPHCPLQPRAQRSEPGHFENIDRLADAFDFGCAERLENEVAFAKSATGFADRDRTDRGGGLHPRRQVDGMPDRRVLDLTGAGLDRADHDFAGVDADAALDRGAALGEHLCRIPFEFLLHPQRCIERPLRMVLMRHRRAEQREDAITRGLHDVTVVAVDGIHHQRQRRIDDVARLLGVEFLHQFGRALEVGEQRRHRLALALDRR